MIRSFWLFLAASLCWLATSPLLAQQHPNIPLGERGELPKDADGRPLNFDFETGNLDDWIARGNAFQGQPMQGEIDDIREPDSGKQSQHTGEFWLGGYERQQDGPRGTLVSVPFQVTHPYASFLIGGGNHRETRVELVREDNQDVVFWVSGENRENLRPVIVDLQPLAGERIFIRIVDQHSGGWGHVNFDDFRLYHERPEFSNPQEVIRPAPAIEQLYPDAGLDADAAARAMKLPEGFSVQVGAAEPDVHQPIAMALDDRGRLWIAEAYEYPTRAPEGEGRDRILIFEDTDGNGSLDKRKLFQDNLNLVSGLEVGLGGVWVGAAPYLLFIPDRDRDDQPDGEPQILLDGWGFEDTHETLNAFIWGPDGWLYGCHGVFTHSRVGKPGTPDDQRVPLNAGIWRYHPTRHQFEVFAHGTSNPWGVDFNDYGQAFLTACVIPHLYHVIQGGRYQRQAGEHFNPHTYEDIKTIARHRHYVGNQWNNTDRRRSDEMGGGHAHAGAMIYLGGAWPADYRNQILMSNIHGNRLNMDRLEQHGSGYAGDRAPDFLLTGDQWSQMLNMRYGPDGQAWLIDWYDANQCHRIETEVHDRSNGRIYRIVYGSAGEKVDVNLATASDEELVAVQLHQNDWYVRHARRVLQERAVTGTVSSAAVAELRRIATQHADDTRRLRALWALHVIGAIDEPLEQELLGDGSPYVRGWTIQLLLEDTAQTLHPALLDRLASMARQDPSPIVRLYLAAGLQRLPLEQRWEIIASLTSHAEDVADHNLPLMYWYAMEPMADIDARRALAQALVAGRGIPLLHEFMVRRIGSDDPQRSLALLVEGLGAASDMQTQLIFLRGLNEALRGRRAAEAPASWPAAYDNVVDSDDADVRLQARALATTFGNNEAATALLELLGQEQAEPRQRRIALDTLTKVQHRGLLPELLQLVRSQSQLRPDALRALATFQDAEVPATILRIYPELSLNERRDALATLCSRPAYAQQLLAAIEQDQIPAGDLTADLVRQLRNLNDEQINQRIEDVWGSVRETAEDKAKLITQYKELIQQAAGSGPDIHLGRAVFAKTCQQCHVLFGVGGDVGPDLTGSNRSDLEYLLSNVVDPSSVMAKEYQPNIIVTGSGRVITGIIRKTEQDALTVQTANETMVLPRDEIDQMQQSPTSMMPDNLLTQLAQHEVRALVAYLASQGQTPMLATEENAKDFFNAKDLAGWRGNQELWSVEDGEIVGRSPGIAKNEFLVNELAVEDFELTIEVKLVPNEANSGIQFRSKLLPGDDVEGYQADMGAGWWGKLYEEHGRGLLWDKPGEQHVKPGQWNRYRIVAEGSHIRTWLNDQPCVDLDDPQGARRGIIGLQIHSGGPLEVRFRNPRLRVITKN